MFNRFKKTAAVILAASLCMILLAGCGKINANETAVTVNGETLSAGAANTYTKYQQAESYSMMVAYGLIEKGAAYWDSVYDTETNQTYGDYILDEIKDELVKMMLIRQNAPQYGYNLSEEQKAAITEAAAKFVSDNGSVADWIGADQASVENVLSLMTYQEETRDLFIADVDREVSDEEASQSTVLYAFASSTMPEGYEGTEEEYDASAKELMEKMLEASKTADLEEVEAEAHAEEEDADAEEEEAHAEEAEEEELTLADRVSEEVHAYSHVAAEISEDITVTSASYSTNRDDSTLDAAVTDAAKTLSDGEFYDGVIKTDNGYYIVKMEAVYDEEKTEAKKDTIISERETTAYDELIKSWQDAAEIVYGKGFDSIKISDKESYVTA